MNWQDRISADPLICHGQACIKGTRAPVSDSAQVAKNRCRAVRAPSSA